MGIVLFFTTFDCKLYSLVNINKNLLNKNLIIHKYLSKRVIVIRRGKQPREGNEMETKGGRATSMESV